MSALARLREHGLRLHGAGERLIVEPRSALTDELRALIRAEKQTILDELAGAFAGARATRQAKVEAELRSRPELRITFDVANAPLQAVAGEPVSVVLAVRHGDHILSGEVYIPRERWDMAIFLRTVDPGSPRQS